MPDSAIAGNQMSSDFDSLAIPPLDPYGLDLGIEGDVGFEFTFDDHYFPSETEDFIAGLFNGEAEELLSEEQRDSSALVDARVLDYPSPESGNSNDFGGNFLKDLHSLSSELLVCPDDNDDIGKVNFDGNCNLVDRSCSINDNSNENSNEVVSEPVSSQDSETMNCVSLDNTSKDVTSGVVDCKIKKESRCLPKRKKEYDEDGIVESRSSKFHRSSSSDENGVGNKEDKKRVARLMRNRESAQLSRQRKKHYVEELEDKVRSMHSAIADLNTKISFIMAENANLRQQLSGGAAMYPPPPHGVYPHAPMPYPWMPYVVKSQGSQVPLVPIPRLKPQHQPVSATSKGKKSENKKVEGKSKKVASVSFLGLLFFIFLFAGLVPMVNNKYGGIGDKVYGQHQGRILTVSGHRNGCDYVVDHKFSNRDEKLAFDERVLHERGKVGERVESKQHKQGSNGFVHSGNSSEPLVASLYVPRNDKLVKIDGNLIIHSVLASEKAMASHKASVTKNNDKTGLAVATNLAPALAYSEAGRNRGRHPHLYRNPTERQRALASGSTDSFKDHAKSASGDGKLQQWFREGLAGPMLSSGTCTEVFQFDVSPAANPGGVIPASPVNTSSADHGQNSTHLHNGKNRRILHGLPLPLNKFTLNITEEHGGRKSQEENFSGNKSISPIVVSVLVDPREAGDGEGDGMMGHKSLSRIFVVVLMDSVKYVTYSCMLPLMGSGPHLTT